MIRMWQETDYLLCFYHILINYGSLNVETDPKHLLGERCILVYHFQEFGTTRAEKGVEDNFLNKHPILVK